MSGRTDDSAGTASARLLRLFQAAGHDKARLIFADVHGLVRKALRQLLEAEGYAVAAEAATYVRLTTAARSSPN